LRRSGFFFAASRNRLRRRLVAGVERIYAVVVRRDRLLAVDAASTSGRPAWRTGEPRRSADRLELGLELEVVGAIF
jgi:hypothetical protein